MLRPLAPLLVLALLALPAPPATAAEGPLVAVVAPGDPDEGQGLVTPLNVLVAFLDANGNSRLDVAAPDEPVYLDLDASRTVTYGDLRLTRFARYAAGTLVDVTNRDGGRTLSASQGWFAKDGDAWFVDLDANGRVGAGDLRIAQGTPEKVLASDADAGRVLAVAEPRGSLARAGGMPWAAHLYLDADGYTAGRGRVSAGDLRITPAGMAPEDEASQADLDAAIAGVRQEMEPPAASTAVAADAPADAKQGTASWRMLDWILVVLGVANLAGMYIIGRVAAARHPRNPFK